MLNLSRDQCSARSLSHQNPIFKAWLLRKNMAASGGNVLPEFATKLLPLCDILNTEYLNK